MPDDELLNLFPNISSALAQTREPTRNADGTFTVEGVTMEDVDNFVNSAVWQRMNVGPAPAVSGQTPRPPQFQAGSGGTPPPAAHLEADAGGNAGAPPVLGTPAAPAPSQETQAPAGEIVPPQEAPQVQPQTAPPSESSADAPGTPGQQTPSPAGPETGLGDAPAGEVPPAPALTPEQIAAYQQFQADVRDDPNLQNLIYNYYAQRTQPLGPPPAVDAPGVGVPPVPGAQAPTATGYGSPLPSGPSTPQAPTPPPDLDLDDPSVARLWEMFAQQSVATQQMLAQVQQQTNSVAQLAMSRQQAEFEGLVNSGVTSFQKDRGLDDAQIGNLRRVAGQMNVLPSLLTGLDPITGLPTPPDPVQAVQRALDIAYWAMPEFRELHANRMAEVQRGEAERKAKLNAVAGGSGSVQRTTPPPAPGTPDSKRALVEEVAQMMSGQWGQS